MSSEVIEVAPLVGGHRVATGRTADAVMPHDHRHVLAVWHKAGPADVGRAIDGALAAHREWSRMDWRDRAAIFLRAADLLAGPYRMVLNAATMLGQSKTVHQAEIDAACELIDFWRFNVAFAEEIYRQQPFSSPGFWNYVEHRPLEGFVFAVTPFNFTSIGGNLPTAAAIMGNTVVWKPASTAVYAAHFIMEILEAAGLPPGVINLVPGAGALGTALTRGAFEYQGQKCSAASRAFIPVSLWPAVKKRLLEQIAEIRVGNPADFGNFMGAVIDRNAFATITGYIDFARRSPDAEVLVGGGADDAKGYFIEPTVILARRPDLKLLREEIFGPVLTVYVFEDAKLDEALRLCDRGSPYALTGAIFARDRAAIARMAEALTHAAGNFYINDKPTGAVVGQQPFGGARASGTNDKAGSLLNLLRWVSPRAIKETFVPPTDFRYPFMQPGD